MSTDIHAVTVYCSSSSKVPRVYFDAAAELGQAIATQKWSLVYGGNYVGLMATVAQGARDAGGKVIGITPKLMADKGVADHACTELIITHGMRERKHLLEHRGDALVALPGGLGTLEELFEVIVAKQLGYHRKPIVLLNVAGFFNPLLAMIDQGVEHQFIKSKSRELYFVADSVNAAIEYIRAYTPPEDGEALSPEVMPLSAAV